MAKKKRKFIKNEQTFNQSLIESELNGLPVNRANWSEKSLGSWTFMDIYTDLTYRCRYCRDKAVFTAKEQQYEYEVKKRYIDQKRVLCQTCFTDMHAKRDAIRATEAKWQSEKNKLQNDVVFLREWLEKLADFQRYNYKSNNTICSLKRRIERLEERQCK